MKQSKKRKIATWLAFIVFFSLLYFQNQEFFDYQDKLVLDLFIFEFNTPPLPVVVYYLGFLLFGFCISFFAGLVHKFRAKKKIQVLEARIQEQKEELEKVNKQEKTDQPEYERPAEISAELDGDKQESTETEK
jgi:hypothetical protein